MFKTLTGINRLESISFEQFMTHWTEIHAPLIREHAAALGIVRYLQLHRPSGAKDGSSGASSRARYDGVAEVWYESEVHFRALGKSEAGRVAVNKIVEDQSKFIGHETPLFKGYESLIIGD